MNTSQKFLYNGFRAYSYFNQHFSPSTRPGFIRSENLQKLVSSLKLLDLNAPIGHLQNNVAGWHPIDTTIHQLPSKIELATVKLFPKGLSLVLNLVVQFLRNQDPFQPRELLTSLSENSFSPEYVQNGLQPTAIQQSEDNLSPSDRLLSPIASILFANVKKKRKSKMNKHKRKKRRRALRYKSENNKK